MATAAAASSATSRASVAAPTVVAPVADPAAPIPSPAHRHHNGAVGPDSAVAASVAPATARVENGTGSVSVSAYVGHDGDHCGVFSNVFGDSSVPPSSSAASSASADDKPEAAVVPAAADGEGDAVSRLVAEKKRRFHSGRLLELKNLPDGCTEQVGEHSATLNCGRKIAMQHRRTIYPR